MLNDAQKEMFAAHKKAIDKKMVPFKEYIKVFESELNKKYNLSDDQKITLDININGLCHVTYTVDIFKNGKMYIFKYYNKNYKSKKTNMKNISDIVENIVNNNFTSRYLVDDIENDLKWRIQY
jgi:alpha-galactosidase/6-phospho-beta-glucosidase family protein